MILIYSQLILVYIFCNLFFFKLYFFKTISIYFNLILILVTRDFAIILYTLPYEVYRSSHQRCSIITGVLRNFAKFTGKNLCPSLFFNKVAGLRPATLLKNRLWHRCFPVNFAKFLRTTFLQNTSGRLLLSLWSFVCNLQKFKTSGIFMSNGFLICTSYLTASNAI